MVSLNHTVAVGLTPPPASAATEFATQLVVKTPPAAPLTVVQVTVAIVAALVLGAAVVPVPLVATIPPNAFSTPMATVFGIRVHANTFPPHILATPDSIQTLPVSI